MILRNGEIVKPKECVVGNFGDTPITLAEELKKITERESPYVFRSKRGFVMNQSPNGFTIPTEPPAEWIMLDSTYTDNETGETELWQYVANPAHAKRNGDGTYTVTGGTRRLKIQYEKVVDVKHGGSAELVWFLLNKSQKVKAGRIYLYDQDAVSKENVEINEKQAEAMHYVYSSESPISRYKTGDEDSMRQVATMWNINVENKKYATIQQELWEKITYLEKNKNASGRGYAEFVEKVKLTTDVGKTANVNLAIQRNIITFNGDIIYLEVKGGTKQLVRGVHSQDRDKWRDQAIEFFLTNKKWYDTMLESLEDNRFDRINEGGKDQFLLEHKFLRGEISFAGETKDDFLILANKYDIRYRGIKKEVYIKELKDKIEEAIF